MSDATAASAGDPGERFLVAPGPVSVSDRIVGNYDQDVAETAGDFLIAKRDGAPAYQLAVVVDDAFDGVTEVVRGDDLLASTPRQVLLQQALGFETPQYAHVPLVLDVNHQRLAKRHDSLSLRELRERGVLASEVVRWAATSCGFDLAQGAHARDGIPHFSWGNLPRGPVPAREFDRAKETTLHTKVAT